MARLQNSWRNWPLSAKKKLKDRLQAQIAQSRSVSRTADSLDLDYRAFLRTTLPAGWTTDPQHIRLISEHLDAVDRGDIDRLAIHLPPRHAKTETVTVRYPVRYLMNHPADNVLLTGYNERFARRLGRKTRNIATQLSAQGKLALDGDKQAADEWATCAGGVLMTRGVGSPPTGVGFKRILIDDPIRRREDAESEVYREKVWDWYTDDLYTRLEPGGAIILNMTLWHDDDIGARAVASEPGRWTVLKLPALAEEQDPLGRLAGEALWPERFDIEALQRIHDVLMQNEGEYGWNALYQQRPSTREGSFFKIAQIQIVEAAPAGLQLCRGWDLAASAGKGDYTAGVLMGKATDGFFYVVDMARGQWDADAVRKVLLQSAMMDGPGVMIHIPQDPGQAGKDQSGQLVRMLAGYAVRSEPISGKKDVRAFGLAAQVNAGNVRLVRGDWNRGFIEEMRVFPDGKHDDQVDAAADSFNELAVGPGKTVVSNYVRGSTRRKTSEY